MKESAPFSVKKYMRVSLETLEDAGYLANEGRVRSAVNRIYYAAFYATSALLLSDGHISKKHSGVRALLHKHYLRTLLQLKYDNL